jgi:hypothetical protein
MAGLDLPEWRKFVCGMMIVLIPSSLLAQVSDRALLRSNGGTWLNGSPAPDTSTIFRDSLIQTQKAHSARIDAEGSSVVVQPETVVQYEGDELMLDHGSLQLGTASQMKVRVDCLTVIPITEDRTQYDVTDVDGKVKVAALRHDVKIHYAGGNLRKSKQNGSSDVIVHEGEQATREEHCGAAIKPTAGLDAEGAILNSPWAWKIGLVAAGIVACIGLCHGDDPISPWKP